jgi:biotin synthase
MHDVVERLLAGPEIQSSQLWEDVSALLSLTDTEFERTVTAAARETTVREFGTHIAISGLIALSSTCQHDCLYCGLRTSNTVTPRFRLSGKQAMEAIDLAAKSGLTRIFLVSGEDPALDSDGLMSLITHAKTQGLHLSLGFGERPHGELDAFRDAGADCYALKFETSDNILFRRMKPTTTYEHRMAAIWHIRNTWRELGSGNIIGLPEQSVDDIVSDILLMHELSIQWAPVVPFLPAPGTPLGDSPAGDVSLTLRVLSIIRLLLPHAFITASQPSRTNPRSFADPDGNLEAIRAGANLLFVDMTPRAVRNDFRVTPGRILPELSAVDDLLASLKRIRS